jgi:uncharacterized protein (TIGR02246 family)
MDSTNGDRSYERELRAIQRMRDKDIAASKAGDFITLMSLFTEDAVAMPPGGHAVRGQLEREAQIQKSAAVMSQWQVLEYDEVFEETLIMGDVAVESGEIRGTMRPKYGGPAESSSYKVMRVLKRQPDGEWKIYRTIWNENPKSSG